MSHTALVVVRYFGGTKLGTGGLIKAYRESARLTLDNAVIVITQPHVVYEVALPFNLTGEWNRIIHAAKAEILSKSADTELHFKVRLPENESIIFEKKLQDFPMIRFTR